MFMFMFMFCFLSIIYLLFKEIFNKYNIIKLTKLINALYNALINKTNIYAAIVVILVSLNLRMSILFFFNLDVFTNPYDYVSIVYFLIMAFLSPLIRYILREFLSNNACIFCVLFQVLLIKSFWFSVCSLFLLGYI